SGAGSGADNGREGLVERARDGSDQIPPIAARSSVAEGVGVTVERGRAAEMGVEHLRSLREEALLREIDHALHRFALVDRIRDHAFEPRDKPDRLLGLIGWYAIDRIGVVLDQNHV